MKIGFSKSNDDENVNSNSEDDVNTSTFAQSAEFNEMTDERIESISKGELTEKSSKTQDRSLSKTSDVFNLNENKMMLDHATALLPINFSKLADTPITYFTNETFINTLLDKTFKEACVETLRFLALRHGFSKLAWVEERDHETFTLFFVTEDFGNLTSTLDSALCHLDLQKAIAKMTVWQVIKHPPLEFFPLTVGHRVRAAIVIGDQITNDEQRRQISYFCQEIAISLEVLRLRDELAKRAEIVRAVQLFNEKLNAVEAENSFDLLMEACVELLGAERASLLAFDEIKEQLHVLAAFGTYANKLKQMNAVSGERVAERVTRDGKPVIVEDVEAISLSPAPAERGYRSNSFISFPLVIGQRMAGVLNLTEKRNGTSYTQNDLKLLEAIAPQLAIAIDRAKLERRAGQLEQLSITDGLTGLLNRRYLNERLSEEVTRSQNNNLEMSFILIDLDNFKRYNDTFGHQAGDEALKIVAQCLKANLRTTDIAARYGGEEFSLLLPQTALTEAHSIAERVRERIETTEFPHGKVTVSIGVSAFSPLLLNTPQLIVEAADKGLYQSKRTGKNSVNTSLF